MFLKVGEILNMWREELGRPNYLYVLHDPRSGEVCYVGITKQTFRNRLLQHRNPKNSNQASVAKLQRYLKRNGMTLEGEVLAKGSEEFISMLEKYVITGFWRYLGKNSIKNHQIGGRDSFGRAPESKQKYWETINKKRKEGLYESREGEKSSSSKLKESQVLNIYNLIKQFYSNSEIIETLNLNIGITGLNQIRHGKSWKYLWKREGMLIIPSLKKENGGLSSPTKVEIIKQINRGVDLKFLQSKYGLSISDLKRVKEKVLWKPVWFIYNNFIINNKKMSSIFDGREVYKPYDFPEVEKNFTEPIQDGYWVHRELEFDKDVQNYRTDLTETDRQIISRILRTFAEVEVHVADDLWSKIGRFLPRPEFCEMGYCFAENESRHASAYFRINEVLNLKEFEPYSKDPLLSDKFENLINSSLNFDFDKTNPEHIKRFAFGLAVFSAFTERVALFGQFMILKSFSANGRNYMKTVGNVIDWSKREESLHGDGGIYIFNKIKDECNWIWTNEFKSSIYVAFTTGMDIETKLIHDIFNGSSLPNLTAEQVINYMKNRANDSLKKLGLKNIFDIDDKVLESTRWFDLESNATQFTDFLAGSRPTDYAKNMVVFDESTVRVSEGFLNKLDKNYITNGRMD